MTLAPFIKEIGRGRDGARDLTRQQASEVMGQILDGVASELEIGAFCIAMRVKGETPAELAGFCDAVHQRAACFEAQEGVPTVVLPSYNGARKLPLLTPLLALLLARQGVAVLVHGTCTEPRRVAARDVFMALGIAPLEQTVRLQAGQVCFAPTEVLHPGLRRLLQVRQVLGLRNPAHSVAKLLFPVRGAGALVSSYTHPEYALSMGDTMALMGVRGLLLRGTEGEPVADPRRTPRMQQVLDGVVQDLHTQQEGPLAQLPELPTDIGAQATAAYIRAVLSGALATPAPLVEQAQRVLALLGKPL
ncbi:MAG: DNA-binding protein YbiB [Rhodoferax sp.]